MATEKMTKVEMYEVLKGIVEASDYEDKDGAIEFVDHQIELLAAKAEKAKERAAAKKVAGDELRAAVEGVLTGELQTADVIAAQVAGEDVTKAKVVSRLTQLVKAGIVEKDTVKTEDGRKVMAYRVI